MSIQRYCIQGVVSVASLSEMYREVVNYKLLNRDSFATINGREERTKIGFIGFKNSLKRCTFSVATLVSKKFLCELFL